MRTVRLPAAFGFGGHVTGHASHETVSGTAASTRYENRRGATRAVSMGTGKLAASVRIGGYVNGPASAWAVSRTAAFTRYEKRRGAARPWHGRFRVVACVYC